MVVFGERHLRHLLRAYADYYNRTRTHLSLDKDSPASRAIEPFGRIQAADVIAAYEGDLPIYHQQLAVVKRVVAWVQ